MFAAEDALSYRIDVDEPADHRRLLDAVYPAAASGCAGIVCIAPASPEPGSPEPGSPESGSPESGPPELGSPEPGSDQPTVTDRSRLWKPALLLLQQVLRTRFAASPAIWLCSHGAQPVDAAASADPWQALLWGLGRTVALESAGEVRLVDLDPTAPPEASAENLADEMTMPSGEAQVVRRGGSRFVARLRARGGAEPGAGTAASGAATIPAVPFRLQFGETGSFDELRFVSCDLPVLAPDQVQLRIAAAGLNFSDVLKAMGLYPGVTERHPPLGIECAGTVTQVGERVDRFVVGDRVTGVAPYTFASHTVTADYTLVPIPLGLGFEEASTIPIVFLTAHYALRSLGRLQPKEKVLIHAGAGGVGLAAIQVARAVGAEIFATAGSDAKRDYLRGLGVPHVFNSRTTEFAGAIMEFTEGRGVDVVLNSLPGEAIHESLKILGPFGRFLEIGKTDIYQDQMIGLAPFRDNLSYFAIDLDRMLRQRPAEISRLFGEVMESFSSGAYGPLPYRKFPAEEVAAAFRHMAQRKNIGKVVVELAPDGVSGDEAEVTGGARRGVRADATYLIVGGLGALGMRLAEWLIESGARSIVLMARRAPSSEQQARFSRFPADVRVVCVRADVADAASLRDGLAQIPADRPPLAGVIHAAGGLADGLLYDMDPADFEAVLKAKVDGGWNLHKASADWHLDFFLLFSSVASILGSPGQGNYAAANAFLDSLAAYRRARGLPATVINWGPWADGGMAADQQHEAELEQRGMRLLRPDECLAITDRLLRDPEALQTVVADIDWPVLSRQFPAGPPPLLEGFADRWEPVLPGGGPPRADRAFFRQWRQADETGRQELLEDYLISELSRVLATSPADLEKDQPLSLIGVDSLMAMELKTNLESRLSVEIPLAALMDGPTLSSLVDDLLPLVARSVGAAQAADTASTAHESASVSGHDWAGGSLNGSVDGAADASLDSSLDNSLDGSGDGSGDGAAGGSVDGAAGGSADGAAGGSADGAAGGSADGAAGGSADGAATPTRSTAAVVPLSNGPASPPIFCLHPVGGDLRCYQTLSRHLGKRRRVMAIRPRRSDDPLGPHDDVEALAADYCRLIREVQSADPYLLLGWSTGGVFAYAMARQLIEQGQRVELLLIDTPTGASLDHVDVNDDLRFLYDLVRFSEWFSGVRMAITYEDLASLGRDEAIKRVLAQMTARGVLPIGTTRATLEFRIETARTHLRAVLRYQPAPLGQPVKLYRPRRGSVLSLATGRQLEDDLGWGRVLGGDLRIERVAGDHFSMLTGEEADRLAETIGRAIDERFKKT